MALIQLSNGPSATVDDGDFATVERYTWCGHRSLTSSHHNKWYAKGWITELKRNVYLHRFLLSAPRGVQVDHIDNDGLNNQRANLRLCSPSQNSASAIKRVGASGFRGVHFFHGRWRAMIQVNGKIHHVGSCKDVVEAARCYDAAALKFFGQFARLNFPSEAL